MEWCLIKHRDNFTFTFFNNAFINDIMKGKISELLPNPRLVWKKWTNESDGEMKTLWKL
jgi:hypothetical protein